MNGGILKRGTVDITIEANNKNKFSLFTVKLYLEIIRNPIN